MSGFKNQDDAILRRRPSGRRLSPGRLVLAAETNSLQHAATPGGKPEPQLTDKPGRGAGVHLKSTLLRYYAQLAYHGTFAISIT